MKGSAFYVDSCDIFTNILQDCPTFTGTIVWIAVPVTSINWNILGSARETLVNPVRGSFVNYHFSDFYLPHQWVRANRTGLSSIHLNGNVVLIKMLFTGLTGSFHLDNRIQWWKFRHYFGRHSEKNPVQATAKTSLISRHIPFSAKFSFAATYPYTVVFYTGFLYA